MILMTPRAPVPLLRLSTTDDEDVARGGNLPRMWYWLFVLLFASVTTKAALNPLSLLWNRISKLVLEVPEMDTIRLHSFTTAHS